MLTRLITIQTPLHLHKPLLITLMSLSLLACNSDPSSRSSGTPEPLSDPTSIDVSNDILIPPVLASATPNPTADTRGTEQPAALTSNGRPKVNPFDALGNSLAIDAIGSTLATGAPGHDSSGQQDNGAVWVEFRVGEQWWFDTLLTAEAATENAQLGYATAISEDGQTIAAGAPHDRRNGRSSGAVFIFERFGEGWQSTAELYSPVPTDNARFGHVVELQPDGETLYVSESRPQGLVHIFQRISSQWQYTQTLASTTGVDAATNLARDGRTADGFGAALSAANNGLLAIGAPKGESQHKSRISTGEVYLYRTNTPSPILLQTLMPPEIDDASHSAWQEFGSSIALSADETTLVISGIEQPRRATGLLSTLDTGLQKSLAQALVYSNTEDELWSLDATLIPAGSHASDSQLTVAVSANGQRIITGLTNHYWQDNQVSVITKFADVWTLSTRLIDPKKDSQTFGDAIALTADGTRVVVSAADSAGGKVYQWLPQADTVQ